MSVTEQGLLAALSSVLDPHTGKDFVSTRALRNVQISGGDVAFDVELGYPAKSLVPELRRQPVAAARAWRGEQRVGQHHHQGHRPRRAARCAVAAQVKNIIAVASGKGGVGKSTTPPTWPGPGRRGPAWRARRRHLRPQPAHDAGHQPPPR